MQYPSEFLYKEANRTVGATTYISAEFGEIWAAQRREIQEKGFNSSTRYDFAVSRITTLCKEKAGFILSFTY
jgi:hypothetical protein